MCLTILNITEFLSFQIYIDCFIVVCYMISLICFSRLVFYSTNRLVYLFFIRRRCKNKVGTCFDAIIYFFSFEALYSRENMMLCIKIVWVIFLCLFFVSITLACIYLVLIGRNLNKSIEDPDDLIDESWDHFLQQLYPNVDKAHYNCIMAFWRVFCNMSEREFYNKCNAESKKKYFPNLKNIKDLNDIKLSKEQQNCVQSLRNQVILAWIEKEKKKN
jgi:hypothetical protein